MYSMYFMLHAVVNKRADITNILKHTVASFICVMNPDRLVEIEDYFRVATNPTILYRKKNARPTLNCSEETDGVNLKYNFKGSDQKDVCDPLYAGSQEASEPETKVLLQYIQSLSSKSTICAIYSK